MPLVAEVVDADSLADAVAVELSDELADELASYGPEVRVVEPAVLRETVIQRLRAAAEAHATVAEGSG